MSGSMSRLMLTAAVSLLSVAFAAGAARAANSDEAARGFRDNVAQDSDMMSPGVWRLAGE
jgi:hypothetical protein